MKGKIYSLLPVLLIFLFSQAYSEPLYSPTWGFCLDLPEDYEYVEGDGRDRFSFENPEGAMFDMVIYHGGAGRAAPYASLDSLARDVQQRLNNRGEMDTFVYQGKNAIFMELSFSLPGAWGRTSAMSGWALCMELGSPDTMLFAMAYGPEERRDLYVFHLSALDSIAPDAHDRLVPGPVTEYVYPRQRRVQKSVFGLGLRANVYEEDSEGAQALIDREYQVLLNYVSAQNWREAWIRFYRAIYRDSFDRLADIAFQLERSFNVPPLENRDFADEVLSWVQSFSYERDLLGSDFLNLSSAATEGRGDCDSRAMLWAIVLRRANIPSAIMVSRYYSHAMGLADLGGPGARFEVEGRPYLVAETTAQVPIGLIGASVSDNQYWLAISFE